MLDFDELREPTEEELLLFRRVARIIRTTALHEEGEDLAQTLMALADLWDTPDLCEACDGPGVMSDVDGVPLCERCWKSLASVN